MASSSAPSAPLPFRGGSGVATAFMALGLFAVPLVFDTRAEAAFDAPKRLLSLLSIGGAAAALLWGPSIVRPRRGTGALAGRIALLGALVAVLAVAAALASPRPEVAFDATRAALLYAVLPLIGASAAAADARGRTLLAAFLGSSLVNALASILQASGQASFYAVEARSGRQDTGALLGNEGHLAITLALASIVALALVLEGGRPRLRLAGGLALGLCGSALLVNRSLTAVSAAVAGAAMLAALKYRRRALVPLGLVAATAVMAVSLVPPIRERAGAVWSDARRGEWDRLLTYRLGPWAAALEMIRERPVLGFGPGTFEAEFVPHRLAAEVRYRTRFLNPTSSSSYGEAHSDYLQLGAEMGVPALLAALLALAALLWKTLLLGLRDGPQSGEARLLSAILVTGAVTALTWFPLQQTALLLPLGLAAGRAWALISGEERA